MADPFAMRDRAASRAIQMQRLRLAAEAEARQQAMAQQGLAARQAEMQARQQGLQMQERQFGRAESNDQFRNELAWRQYKQQQEQNKAQMASRAAESAERRASREAAEKKERMRLQGLHAQDLSSLEAINDSTQGIIGRMGSIQSNKGFESNFGMFPEVVTRYIPGKNYNTKVELEQLEDMAKTSGLSQIRAGAGQSIGTITEREWPIIASQLLKLNVGQTDEAAKGMLGTARRSLLNMRNRELREYQNKWKDSPFYKEQPFQVPPVETQGKLAGIPKTFAHGQEVWDHLTPEEKALWMPGLDK